MDNLDELERQRAANRERRRLEQGSQEERNIENEPRRVNYQQSDIERETHRERTVCHRKEEEKRCQILSIY
jgi:hypothetical protein